MQESRVIPPTCLARCPAERSPRSYLSCGEVSACPVTIDPVNVLLLRLHVHFYNIYNAELMVVVTMTYVRLLSEMNAFVCFGPVASCIITVVVALQSEVKSKINGCLIVNCNYAHSECSLTCSDSVSRGMELQILTGFSSNRHRTTEWSSLRSTGGLRLSG